MPFASIVLWLVVLGVLVAVYVVRRRAPAPPALTKDEEFEVCVHLDRGDVVEAIRTYRRRTGCGLADARDAVDELRGR